MLNVTNSPQALPQETLRSKATKVPHYHVSLLLY